MRIGLGVVVLLALAVALWVGLASDNEAAVRPAAPPAAEERAAEPVATPVTVANTEPQPRVALETPAGNADAAEFVYRVRVVHADTQEAVAGAVVDWLSATFDYAALTDEDRALQLDDNEAFVAKVGKSATTDGAGRVSIPGRLLGVYVIARRGELFGQSGISAQLRSRDQPPKTVAAGTEFTVEVRADRTLTTRAIDTLRRPVPGVWIEMTRAGMRSTHGPTDTEGLMHLRHAQQLSMAGQPGAATLRAVLFGGHGDAVGFDLAALPDQPIDVPVPPFGSIEVVLFGPNGLPWQTPNECELRVEVKPHGAPDAGTFWLQNSLLLGADGAAVAEPVLCGLEFDVRSWTAFDTTLTLAGPTRAGERVRAELRMPTDTPILTGRVVDAEHEPLAAKVRLQCEYGRGMMSAEFTTKADGLWRMALTSRMLGQPATLTLTRADSPFAATEQQAHVGLPAPLASGTTDVGDVVLATAPVLVAGRVRWQDGTPVEPPQIELDYTDADRRSGWQQLYNLRPAYPGDGRFVVRGAASGRRYRLRVGGDIAPRAPIEFAAGTEDLLIDVEKGSSVTARFLVDAATPWQLLQYHLDPPTGTTDPDALGRMQLDFRMQGRPRPDGESVVCSWHQLTAGPHRLTVRCPGEAAALADFSVDVPRGGAADDPRLQGIDLRGRVRKFAITVTDAAGAPIRGARDAGVLIKGPDDPQAEWYGRTLNGETGHIELTATGPLDLIVFGAGFQQRELSGVFADASIALDTAPCIRVRLAPVLALPAEAQVELYCGPHRERGARSPRYRLDRGDGGSNSGTIDSLLAGSQRVTLDADGSAELTLAGTSPHDLALRLQHRSDRRKRASLAVQPASLDPTTLRPGQLVELRVEAEALRQAIGELEKD